MKSLMIRALLITLVGCGCIFAGTVELSFIPSDQQFAAIHVTFDATVSGQISSDDSTRTYFGTYFGSGTGFGATPAVVAFVQTGIGNVIQFEAGSGDSRAVLSFADPRLQLMAPYTSEDLMALLAAELAESAAYHLDLSEGSVYAGAAVLSAVHATPEPSAALLVFLSLGLFMARRIQKRA